MSGITLFALGLFWFSLGNLFQIMVRDGATPFQGFFFGVTGVMVVALMARHWNDEQGARDG